MGRGHLARLQGHHFRGSLHEWCQSDLGSVQLLEPNVATLFVVIKCQTTYDTLAMNVINTTVLLYCSHILEGDARAIKDIFRMLKLSSIKLCILSNSIRVGHQSNPLYHPSATSVSDDRNHGKKQTKIGGAAPSPA